MAKDFKDKKPDYVRQFVFQLDLALWRTARVLRTLHSRNYLPISLEKPTERLFKACLDVVYDFREKPDRVSKKLERSIKTLSDELKFFHDFYSPLQAGLKPRARKTILHLSDDIDHFIRNFRMTMKSHRPGARLPHRPKNVQQRLVWFNLVQTFITTYGSFPKHADVYPGMKQAGYTFSAETHGDWKKRYQSGTF